MTSREELEETLKTARGRERILPLLDYAFSLHLKDPDGMLEAVSEALDLSVKHSFTTGIFRCHQLKSIYWGMKGNFEKALEHSLEALSLLDGEREPEKLCSLSNNLSLIYCRLGDTGNGIECARRTIELAERIGNSEEKARGLNNLALNLEERGCFAEAYEHYSRSLELFETAGNASQTSIALLNTAVMAVKTGRIEEADGYAERALRFGVENGYSYVEATALKTLAQVRGAAGLTSEADELFRKALSMAEEMDSTDLQIQILENFTEFCEEIGNYREALALGRKQWSLQSRALAEKQNLKIALLNAEFEARSRERETELYRLKNIDLQKARDAAEASDRAKSIFLAMMSHEIRTPMNIIMGMLQILLDEDPRPDQIDPLEKAFSSTRSLLGIIVDILDFSRIEAGKFVLERVPFDPARVLKETAEMFTQMAEAKGLTIHTEKGADLPARLMGDPVRVGQILRNLVSNGIKFTSEGSVTIRLTSTDVSPDSALLEYSVEDTGMGIPEDEIQQLFQPFHQINPSLTENYGGTGLGLTICSRLVKEMKGNISVNSKSGGGSVFSFQIPFERAADMPDETSGSGGNSALFQGVKVLLVEDMETIREITGYFLESAGIGYRCAANGREALDLVKEEPFDIVLMDIQMPVMDGMEASERIRELGCTMPIIATTGHTMADHHSMYRRAGITDILAKPFTREGLLTMMARWLEKPGGLQSS